MPLMFDAHLDLAWNALSWGRDLTMELSELNGLDAAFDDHSSRGRATVSLPEMHQAGVAACLGTLMARSKRHRPPQGFKRTDVDYPDVSMAYGAAQGQLAYYRYLESKNHIRLIASSRQLHQHWHAWNDDGADQQPIGVIIAMEGADSIVEPNQAEAWFHDGLRSVNLVHYGRNQYAVGTGDDGPLTAAGVRLLAEFQRLGMILDATHLSDTSFFQALEHFGGATIASHNNCREIVPGQRQFSDEQIRLLVRRHAVIGIACDAWMLHPGWTPGETARSAVGIQAAVDQIDHICQLAGNHLHVAIGSDLDGGFGSEQTPMELDSIADLQKLSAILHQRGYSAAAVAAIFHGNWLRFFAENLPADEPASPVD